jgi:5-methylcytosine-specific restriction endonuclease McrA
MAQSWRRSPLPANWPQLRRIVLRRDKGLCQLKGPQCTTQATEVHHAVAHNDHRVASLIAVCSTCHATETGREAGRARQANLRAQGRDAYGYKSRKRPPEQHPGRRTP